ncbi:serine hydrolase domain-containing protein [Aurantiacibacter sp. MUD61]|uniref:serine hydrolase domain-containing protein n=1 Tax=Aurantiacibacter sp. MUD61 TaxID=3009083 RepID=UPI0022F0E96C|nr:serine hydrolase domain-containing protein [Aurantiacibacter sp. MUD61]
MRNHIVSAFAAIACTLSLPALAQPLDDAESAAIDEVMGELTSEGEPGVAVGVVRGGEVILEAYTGEADLAHGIPLGPETRLNIASNAKQYVALMALDMANRGMVDLDEDFRTYLPGVMEGVDQRITVADLISHTSGIRDIYNLWSLTGVTWYERPYRNRDAMELLNRQTGLNFDPGSEHLYSNSNYILLAELIAAVSGQDFHEYAGEFFARIGMEDTGWRRRYGAFFPNQARAYGQWNGWLEDPAIANLFGDGFLFTTLGDQLAWEQQLQGAASALDAGVIAASQARVDDALPGAYGYGLEHGTYRGLQEISHVGSTGGFNAYVRRFPERDLAIVVMGNTTQISVVGLGYTISDILLDDSYPEEQSYAAGPEAVLARPATEVILGLYEGSNTLICITERDGELYREIEGRDPVRLIHEDGNVFAYESNADLKMVFEPSGDGGRQFRIFLSSQPTSSYRMLAPLPESDASFAELEGRFVNPETDTEIVIEHVSGTDFVMIKNGRRRDAQMVQGDELRWNDYRLRYQRDDGGPITGMLVDNGRMLNVDFPRVE